MEEPRNVQSLKQFVFKKADDLFLENLPVESIKQLPPFYKYSFGIAVFCVFLGTFIYFVYAGL